jgi:hypothetical protein
MLEKLPTEFRDAHDLAFVLHDTLVEYVVQGEKERLLFFKVKMRHPEHAKAAAGLKGKALWEWSEQNGYRNALDEHSYRNLVFALSKVFRERQVVGGILELSEAAAG